MLTVEEILRTSQSRSRKPDEDELRRLPYKEAFVYGRVSSPSQVRDSRESIREIASLIELARKDGYRTNLDSAEIEKQLLSGNLPRVGVWEDGEVTVDVQDLGLSGQLLADERKGLAHLQELIERGTHGAVYVTEGVSRLSRDRDCILPFQLLKLLKEKQIRVRAIDGIWNPAIERDWEYLKEQFEDAIEENKMMNKRLHRRKARKAARGEFVGEPIPAGYIVPIISRKLNGQYEYGKLKPYAPHAEVTRRTLEELVKKEGSEYKTLHALGDLEYPYFPEELRYMERLTALRMCPRSPTGYRITAKLIRGLATNLKLIGVWKWGDKEPILHNHEPIVPEELFLKAYELKVKPQKPRGRTVHFEPLEWSGLLWCMNHPEPAMVSSHNARGYYQCDRDYETGGGRACYTIAKRKLDQPLTSTVLKQLDFTLHANEVLSQMERAAHEGRLQQSRDRQEIVKLEKECARWQSLLPCCVNEETGLVDKQKEAYYWQRIREMQSRLEELKRRPVAASGPAPGDFAQVKKFLERLSDSWTRYSPASRNRLLKLLIDRVELRGTRDLEVTIIWKTGFRQTVFIQRSRSAYTVGDRWTPEEDGKLTRLYLSAPPIALRDALPDRSWKSITRRAWRLKLKRMSQRKPAGERRAWTSHDDDIIKARYEAGVPIPDIAAELDRSVYSIGVRASVRKLARPREVKWHTSEVIWNADNLMSLQAPSSGRRQVCCCCYTGARAESNRDGNLTQPFGPPQLTQTSKPE